MLLTSIEQDSDVTKFESLIKLPVEFIIEHQGAKVNISEQDSSSGVCDDR